MQVSADVSLFSENLSKFTTTKNTVISPNFLLCDSPETMRKLCLSAKFPYEEIRWNYGIFHSLHHGTLLLETFEDLQYVEKCSY